jgi:hypothetical protein
MTGSSSGRPACTICTSSTGWRQRPSSRTTTTCWYRNVQQQQKQHGGQPTGTSWRRSSQPRIRRQLQKLLGSSKLSCGSSMRRQSEQPCKPSGKRLNRVSGQRRQLLSSAAGSSKPGGKGKPKPGLSSKHAGRQSKGSYRLPSTQLNRLRSKQESSRPKQKRKNGQHNRSWQQRSNKCSRCSKR